MSSVSVLHGEMDLLIKMDIIVWSQFSKIPSFHNSLLRKCSAGQFSTSCNAEADGCLLNSRGAMANGCCG